MSKTLQTAAIIVAAVAVTVASAGTLAPAATATALAAIGVTATAAATVAALAAAATVLSIGAQLTATKPLLGGSQTTFNADPLAGAPYLIGRSFNAGDIIYRRTYNTPGYGLPDLQAFGVILSAAGPIHAIESFQSDKPTQVYDNYNNLIASTNTTVTFDGAGAAIGNFAGWMWQTTQLGACPESGVLAKTYGGVTPPNWDATSKLSGMAAAMWTLRYDQKGKFFAQGVPAPGWVIQGVLTYDPRLDSTYPGGAGACRAGVESTYVYNENPYLHALTFALGRYQNGVKVMGVGAPIAGIDVAAFVEGANVADANGWKVGGRVRSIDDKWNILKLMLEAGGGEPMHLGAKLSCLINTPRVVLDTVTVADIIGEVSVTATQSRRDRINALTPSYRSEAHLWEMVAAASVRVASYQAMDGGLRTREYAFQLVQQLGQAVQLARYAIENSREFGPVVLPLKLRWYGYKPGDCIAVTLPESGLAAQPVVITKRTLSPGSAAVTLTARSETPGKHAFALGQTGTAPPTPSVTGAPIVPVPLAGDWAITATGLTAGGVTTPALIVAGAATNTAVDGIVFEYRLYAAGQADDAGWNATGGADLPTAVRKEITALLSATRYEAAVSYQLRGSTGARRIIGPVTLATGTTGPTGSTGAPGATGPSGASLYTWIAYADTIDGSLNFTTGAPGGRGFIGVAPNQTTAVEGTVAAAYAWSSYTGPPTFGLVNNGGVAIASNRIIAVGQVYPTFAGAAYSSESYTGACTLSFRASDTQCGFLVGLNTDPTTDNNWTSLDYAWHPSDNGQAYVFGLNGGGPFFTSGLGFYDSNTNFQIIPDGVGNVRMYANGLLYYAFTGRPAGERLFFDSSFRGTSNPSANTAIILGFNSGGAPGPIGGTGATGTAGATGSNGAAGSAGATGGTGATGTAGATGSNGAAGSAGATGGTGATGTAGATGSNGAAGATGGTGATGATGAQGPAGVTALPITPLGSTTSGILMAPGSSITIHAVASYGSASGTGTLRVGVQVAVAGGAPFATVGTSPGDGYGTFDEPSDEVFCTYTNGTGLTQLFTFSAVVTGATNHPQKYSQSYIAFA